MAISGRARAKGSPAYVSLLSLPKAPATVQMSRISTRRTSATSASASLAVGVRDWRKAQSVFGGS